VTGEIAAPGTRVVVGVRPQHVKLADGESGIPAMVRLSEALGSETVVHADIGGQHRLVPGDQVRLSLAGAPLHVFGEDGLRR
jgi:ABC-type sugar transport system ATPase subunit